MDTGEKAHLHEGAAGIVLGGVRSIIKRRAPGLLEGPPPRLHNNLPSQLPG